MLSNKLHKGVFAAIVGIFALICVCGCNENSRPESDLFPRNVSDGDEEIFNGICFLDAGCGDCALVMTEGICFLIDCGNKSKHEKDNLFRVLESSRCEKIDYFVLSHPDEEHIGNAEEILSRYKCKNLLVPFTDYEYSESFVKAVSCARKKGVEVKEFNYLTAIKTENLTMFFLYPEHKYSEEFNKISLSEIPTEKMLDEISPIIYLDIEGIRILLNSDASTEQEKKVCCNFKSGLYDMFFGKGAVDLYDVDILKASGHGKGNATSEEFLQIVNPDKVVVSCGGINIPNTETLKRIYKRNGKADVFRTDLNGNVTVKINNGKYSISASMQ